jgi:RNA polymerase sigma factor (sigma-70 family)
LHCATISEQKQSKNLSMEEVTLIKQCIDGNPRAQKALFDMFAPKMFSVCMRYVKDKMRAEDVLQDALVKIYSKLPEYKFEGVFEGWIRRIVVNTCLDQLRKDQKFLKEIQVEEVSYRIEQHEFIAEKLMADDLMKLIQSMPDGYRVVFNMFAIEGYSHKEISKELGVTESTSKSQYLRARAYLKDRIEKR